MCVCVLNPSLGLTQPPNRFIHSFNYVYVCIYILLPTREQVSNTLRFVSAAHNEICAVGGRALLTIHLFICVMVVSRC